MGKFRALGPFVWGRRDSRPRGPAGTFDLQEVPGLGPRPSATPAAEPGSLWGEGLLGFSVNSATPASEGHKKIVFMGPASFLHHLQLLGTFLRLWGLRCSEAAALIHAPPITSGGGSTFLSPLLGKLHFLVLRQPQLPSLLAAPAPHLLQQPPAETLSGLHPKVGETEKNQRRAKHVRKFKAGS